jgi:hypothetical protein
MKHAKTYLGQISWAAVALALLATFGCSPDEPETQGSISLRVYLEEPAMDGFSLIPTQGMPDSVVARVFRGGAGANLETSSGAAINGASEVDLTITCVAEEGKKVSVELFSGPHMVYFGVNEQVDVVESENTNVMIDAWDMYVSSIDVTPTMVIEGASYTVYWSRPTAAGSFLLLESPDSDFPQQVTQSYLTTDTTLTFQRPAGAYYYAVVPINTYAWGTVSNVAYGYVQTVGEQPPSVNSVYPSDAAPGERVTLRGSNMDLPGTRVFVGGVECPVVSAKESELDFVVAVGANTGTISLETLMGIINPLPPVWITVNRIAYVSATGGDADWYADLMKGESSIISGLAMVPLAEVADRDMRVFDVIILADDVGSGGVVSDSPELDAIVNSGANVLAVGRGGRAYVSEVITEIKGLSVTTEWRQDLYVLDGSVPIFQSPYPIAPQGPATVQMCRAPQPFAGIDIDILNMPLVTPLAALSIDAPQSYVMLYLGSGLQNQVHNVYWGFEGKPAELSDQGQECVLNILNFLDPSATSVPPAFASKGY